MDTETLKIKCPHCGAVLTIKSMPNLASKSVPCPVCKQTSPFTAFKRVVVKPAKPADGESTLEGGQYVPPIDEDATRIGGNQSHPSEAGCLRVYGSDKVYPLSWGVNTIGRKAQTSSASVQLEVTDRSVSRLHAAIEVKRVKGGCLHYLSNAENKNKTYVNSLLLEQDDVVILHDGDTLQMGNVTVVFLLRPDGKKR